MKREVIFVLVFVLFLVSTSLIYADEASQVENAYNCLSTRINQTGCSSLTFDEKVFSALASGECRSELSADNSSNQCWPKSGCKIKSTAQAILALNSRVNTTKAENWLLSQTGTPSGLDWFLEIEIGNNAASSCTITYSGSSYTIYIGTDKRIDKNAGNLLKVTSDGYWLQISPSLYNKDITINCKDNSFITTLLFKRSTGTGSSTVHVSDKVNGAGAGGATTEKVDALCFVQSGSCNYEGSLWAALVLRSVGDDISNFLPYLITMKDDLGNSIYIPESFLYYITGKFQEQLLLEQMTGGYWEESGDRYYDTATALLPFGYDNSMTAKSNAKTWLLANQQKNGCWNNGNIKDTAFLLFSIWPKDTSPVLPAGVCQVSSDCPDVSCKSTSCTNRACVYAYLDCQNNDGCCNPGCTNSNDNDCVTVSCTSNSDCPSEDYSDNYCSDSGDVYRDAYTYSCDTSIGECVQNSTSDFVESCDNNGCDGGKCVGSSGCTTGFLGLSDSCPSGQKCVNGVCIDKGGTGCTSNSNCSSTEYGGDYCNDDTTVYRSVHSYSCDTSSGTCVDETNEELVTTCTSDQKCDNGACVTKTCTTSWLFGDSCPSGESCNNGVCVPDGECTGTDASACPQEDCKTATCDSGTCLYNYIACSSGDSCCNPGCNYSVDTDCTPGPECTLDSDCSNMNYQDPLYCGGTNSKDLYITSYNYTCQSGTCVENTKDELVKECTNQECYAGECYGTTTSCQSNNDCSSGQICDNGVCVESTACTSSDNCSSGETCTNGECVQSTTCTNYLDCNYYENCVGGVCTPYACQVDTDCVGGVCVNGECTASQLLDCEAKGYYCTFQANCDNAQGNILSGYFCTSGDLFACCDKQPTLNTCDYEGGTVCTSDQECVGGTYVEVSNNLSSGEACCVSGDCEVVNTTTGYCTDNGGTCKDSCDSSTEQEKSYTCDSGTCCVPCENGKCTTSTKGKAWILIVLLLILIILAVLGIVFRDKLRTQWIKIKDKLGGKKEKKKFEMPMTMHPNPQGRILPRRILPPGQGQPTNPQLQSRFPIRGAIPSSQQQPLSRPTSQAPVTSSTTLNKSPGFQPAVKTATTTPQQSPTTQQQQPVKKPEEKPKSELDDVLKKLKEMGNKDN